MRMIIDLTEEELGVLFSALQRFCDIDSNPYLTEEQYDLAQSTMSEIERAM